VEGGLSVSVMEIILKESLKITKQYLVRLPIRMAVGMRGNLDSWKNIKMEEQLIQ
jgi:hypothetical protein